jgi:hypothetical protein
MAEMGKMLILTGVLLSIAGLLLLFVPHGTIPRLPGDIYIKRDNFVFYFPIVTSIIVSILITIILSIFFRK